MSATNLLDAQSQMQALSLIVGAKLSDLNMFHDLDRKRFVVLWDPEVFMRVIVCTSR